MRGQSLEGFHFTFLHGIRVRSGTNYLGKVMSRNTHIQSVPPAKTTDEFPLLRGLDNWEEAFAGFVGKFNGNRKAFQVADFLPHLGRAWLSYLIDTFSLQPGHVFLKDPSVRHMDRFFDVFPDSKLIILVRDGRDNVASSVKAGLAKRKHDTAAKRARMRLNHLVMRDFISAARSWSQGIDEILRFDERLRGTPLASRYLMVRYEDVFRDPRHMAERMFTFMEVPFDDEILRAVETADVVGSSFFGRTGREDAGKPNWIARPRTAAFRPVGRWKNWSALQKYAFKRIAGRQLISVGYEADAGW